jgi:8-amino-7-oxononanoate synthase
MTADHVATALACLATIKAEPWRPRRLATKAQRVRDELRRAGLTVYGEGTPIVPVICPTIEETYALTMACQAEGVLVLPVIFPAVPKESPRLRLSITLDHSAQDLTRLVTVVVENARRLGLAT